jgi:hypothetical protein
MLSGGYGYLARPYGLACDSLCQLLWSIPMASWCALMRIKILICIGLAAAAVEEASELRRASLSD